MKTPSLTIATWNLQKCVGMDFRRDPGRSLEVLRDTGAEIAVLQEVDKRLPPRPAALPREMAEAAGWTVLPFGRLGPGGSSVGWHGNAMLVRPGIEADRIDRVHLPGLEPRGAIEAELATAIGPLRIIGVHLGLRRRDRLGQLHAVATHLERRPRMPTLLAGDINEWGRIAVLDHVLDGLDFLDSPPSYPALRPVGALDRFALSRDLRALHPPRVHLAQPARIASDHLPLLLTLTGGQEC
ncbi:endonuclease/exonuclease/phosphatase family protein [Pseudooceanicola batsensis HTCC2597]|uniref:Endonuclease/exonuclease/phosphatase family protein n=1 Tax=Pseudooceanicola batsensis (strain ATCC BAA-863 / DSM 15984 / KCTC 12145 / HTCC2597) TaxID=252305 RepID=A3U2P2_PSEBH|nr:endonuclease/exonuclease/phosphatase family protein [Pseudooceanicola batsensis]EAQ01616.1 endonuclease/exonuclease/phosphatase family protein [Pseudooceanicola batsensis HTCC2597]